MAGGGGGGSPRGSPAPARGLEAAKAAAHLNGTMAGMVTLQSLQNLASLQGLPQVASLAAGLQGVAGLGAQLVNTPLNLSASAAVNLSSQGATGHGVAGLMGAGPPPQPQLLAAPQPAAMPQFILASGQLVQGIQGAQLLIPTSQGIATQTILTIPVNHVTSSQMVNLALSNGQVVTTTLANLQTLAQPHHLLAPSAPGAVPSPGMGHGSAGLPPHLLGSAQQQLLGAMQQPQLATPPCHPAQPPPQRHHHHNHNHSHHYPVHEKLHSNGQMNGSESLSAIGRLAASNADITITPSHAAAPGLQKPSPVLASNGTAHHRASPPVDFLADSPNQPTINQTSSNVVDGINLDEIKEFAKAFKLRRLSLGLTQTQVGQALSITEGPAYSQSAICSALATQMYCAAQIASQHQNMFEKLDITPKSAQKIKPVLEMWMKEAEERYKSGQNHLTEFIGVEPSKKRKRRTSFTPQALELLNAHFERNTHPSGTEITALAHQLGYEREVIRIWFCNKRQALKNTVRMMSKGVGVA
ncbi:POU domain, class 6, transcription factor 1 [Bacillus rossius redtenbacheri]|uniref:POU domain, class 6, transcription factor 1 n=1 Tax=Bacillus rossius redtenbacheri TaxID=93214 RepID=UPI002FDCD222